MVYGAGNVWVEHTVDGDFYDARSVYAADVDGDGDMDVLGAARYSNEITWWENADGTGTAWVEHTVDGDFYEAYSVYAADVDGDGNMDVLGAACVADDITWWDLGASYSSSGYLTSSILDADLSINDSWLYFDWNSTEPTVTGVEFQVRASDDSDIMGAWSSTLTSPGSLSGILDDGDRYFQYRVTLSTTDTDSTPTLHDVNVSLLYPIVSILHITPQVGNKIIREDIYGSKLFAEDRNRRLIGTNGLLCEEVMGFRKIHCPIARIDVFQQGIRSCLFIPVSTVPDIPLPDLPPTQGYLPERRLFSSSSHLAGRLHDEEVLPRCRRYQRRVYL